jgi:NAD(P)-dependent dehydrogenase (short-subunit alcohol dehydrogenase family)
MSQPTPPPNPARDPHPPRSTAENSAVLQALQLTRESLAALQRMQEQTAQLHRQFLDGQENAHRTVHLLVEQQQRLLQASLGLPVSPLPAALPPPPVPVAPVTPAPLPAPVIAPPPPVAPASAPAPAPAAVQQAPPAPAVKQPAPAGGRVEGVLLEVVAEKTGYPADMLELGMALDADLGIDSIKRVEILSALQERLPEAPAVKPEHLGALHTLRDIASFLAETTGKTAAAREETPPAGEARSAGVSSLEDSLATACSAGGPLPETERGRKPEAPSREKQTPLTPDPVRAHPEAEPEGRKTPSLERSVVRVAPLPPVAAADLSLDPGAEVWITDDDPVLARAVAENLAALGLRPLLASCSALARGQGSPSPGGLVILPPTGTLSDDWLLDALLAVKQAGSPLRKAGGVLLTASRLDGAFGLAGGPPWREPLDGGLAALAKTVRHEWPEVHARAVDVSPSLPPEVAAERIVREMFVSGPGEVGLSERGRITLDREAHSLKDAREGRRRAPFEPGDLVVVSGGARGVTAEVAVALAHRFRPTLLLLGRSPAPEAEPEWLAGLNDEPALKRELGRRHPGASPRDVGERAKAVLAAREIRTTLDRIRAAGADVLYRSVDVRDAGNVLPVLEEVRRKHGPVRGLVHGAGVLADAKVEDKTAEQFHRVYDTKVAGLRSLLAAVGQDELKALVLFSSSTARFGRTGQVDYAIANEVLNKLAWQESARRPACRVASLNWGPWDGGMVGPALKYLFGREGLGLIPPAAGADLLVEELLLEPPGPREVVVLAEGVKPPSPAPAPTTGPHLPSALPVAFERVLDVADFPVLESHVLDDRPVLPLVLMLEWLAHAALVQNPGYSFHGCDDLRVLQGVALEGPAPPVLRVGAGKAVRREGFFVAPAELRSRRPDGREVLHARAEVVLATALPAAPPGREPPPLPAYPTAEVYRPGILFHGPALRCIERVLGCGSPGVAADLRSAPPPSAWLRQPLRQHWLSDPLVIDGSFQLLILWSLQQRGGHNLPCHVRRYRQYRRAFPTNGVRVNVAVERSTSLHALADIDYLDADGKLVARLEGYECVIDPALQRAFAHNAPTSV